MNLRRRLKSLELKLSHQDISNRPSSIWLIGVEPGGVCQCAGGWVWDGDQYRQASQEEAERHEAQRVKT